MALTSCLLVCRALPLGSWLPSTLISKVSIPMTEGLDVIAMLTDDATIATWNNEGLPNDRMSTENAAILTHCQRWPLMIDPQQQGIKWIKKKYGTDLKVTHLGQKGYEKSVRLTFSWAAGNGCDFYIVLEFHRTLCRFEMWPCGMTCLSACSHFYIKYLCWKGIYVLWHPLYLKKKLGGRSEPVLHVRRKMS